jgi:hypothetical protein
MDFFGTPLPFFTMEYSSLGWRVPANIHRQYMVHPISQFHFSYIIIRQLPFLRRKEGKINMEEEKGRFRKSREA